MHRLIKDSAFRPAVGSKRDAVSVCDFDRPVAPARIVRRHRQKSFACGVYLGLIGDSKAQFAACPRNIINGDARFSPAHRGAHAIFQRFEPIPFQLGHIRLKQDMTATCKVEAEADFGRRHAFRNLVEPDLRQETGQRSKEAEHNKRPQHPDPPWRKIEHYRPL